MAEYINNIVVQDRYGVDLPINTRFDEIRLPALTLKKLLATGDISIAPAEAYTPVSITNSYVPHGSGGGTFGTDAVARAGADQAQAAIDAISKPAGEVIAPTETTYAANKLWKNPNPASLSATGVIGNGTNNLSSATPVFSAGNVGKQVILKDAGGTNFTRTIASFTSPNAVVLNSPLPAGTYSVVADAVVVPATQTAASMVAAGFVEADSVLIDEVLYVTSNPTKIAPVAGADEAKWVVSSKLLREFYVVDGHWVEDGTADLWGGALPYVAFEEFSFTIPATGTYKDKNNVTLTNGKTYNFYYPTAQTSGATFNIAEAAKMVMRNERITAAADGNSQTYPFTRTNSETTLPTTTETTASPTLGDIANGTLADGRRVWWKYNGTIWQRQKFDNAGATIAAATAWTASTAYVTDDEFSVTIPATGTFVDIKGKTLTNGQTYNLVYPTAQTSGAAFNVAEALKAEMTSVIAPSIDGNSQTYPFARASAELTLPTTGETTASPTLGDIANGTLTDGRRVWWKYNGTVWQRQKIDTAGATIATAPAWVAATAYVTDDEFSFTIPATGTFVDIKGVTLVNGQTYNFVYPVGKTSAAAFNVAEALTAEMTALIAPAATSPQNYFFLRGSAELTLPTTGETAAAPPVNSIAHGQLSDGRNGWWEHDGTAWRRQMFDSAGATIAQAPAWVASTAYVTDDESSITIPATGVFVDIRGRTLTNGEIYNFVYPAGQTSGAAFDVAEALKVEMTALIETTCARWLNI